MMGSHRMCETWRFTARPLKSVRCTPSRVRIAMSPSARKNMSRVWLRIAGTSDATKYSPSPRPTTTGGPAGSDNLVRVFARDHAEREHAGQLFDRVAHSIFQISVEVLFDQMRDDLGVRLGHELMTFIAQLLLKREIIFDDAVVHHYDIAVTIAMRVRVFFRGPPVGRPARVADSVSAVHGVQLHHVFEIPQLSGSSPYAQASAFFQYRQARRIIPPIFKPLQAIENDGYGLLFSDISYDSAH